ncbi:MAG: hypothetical protein GOP50_13280, partial [Candidatus Heimdallarchaeota archaeon]|nr:hypothetical protein [Candidatus Heimdallarchaeota archaeon]
STHLILEWTEIYGYFTPEDPYINDLWNDVRPGFDYLLNNTPRLELSLDIDFVEQSSDEFELSVTYSNLSPRIKTMEPIYYYDNDDSLITSHAMIPADYSNIFTFNKHLADITRFEGMYPIFIGNDYVGYREFIIETDPETLDTNSGFTIGLSILGVIIISISSIIFQKKKR